jgi:hypothetical protein
MVAVERHQVRRVWSVGGDRTRLDGRITRIWSLPDEAAIAELRARADAGDSAAAEELARLLAERG